jgi:hypothetical protein
MEGVISSIKNKFAHCHFFHADTFKNKSSCLKFIQAIL